MKGAVCERGRGSGSARTPRAAPAPGSAPRIPRAAAPRLSRPCLRPGTAAQLLSGQPGQDTPMGAGGRERPSPAQPLPSCPSRSGSVRCAPARLRGDVEWAESNCVSFKKKKKSYKLQRTIGIKDGSAVRVRVSARRLGQQRGIRGAPAPRSGLSPVGCGGRRAGGVPGAAPIRSAGSRGVGGGIEGGRGDAEDFIKTKS